MLGSTRDNGRSLRDEFASRGFDSAGWSSLMDPQKAAGFTPDVTNIDTGTNYQVQGVTATPAPSVQGSTPAPAVDFSAQEADLNGQAAQYMAANAEITQALGDAANAVLGPEQGGQFMEQMLPQCSPTKMQAAATIADPTGCVGSIYAVISSVMEQADRFGSQESLEVLDKMLTTLRESTNPDIQFAMEKPPIVQVDPKYDFAAVTAPELKRFMERNPADDPVMQEIQRNLDVIAGYNMQADYVEAHDAEHVTAEKVAVAVTMGDQGRLNAMAAGGNASQLLAPNLHQANEALYQSASLADLNGVQPNGVDTMLAVASANAAIGAAMAAQRDAAGPSWDREEEMRRQMALSHTGAFA